MAQDQSFASTTSMVPGGKQLCLLSLDGGGVRGLSSLQILKQLMELIDPDNPPKPCDYFDMIGGTSTGGLIAIMLGRLRMSVDECIAEYKKLSSEVFTHCRHRMTWRGKLQGRFDHDALERGIKDLLISHGETEEALLKDPLGNDGCRTFVCSTSKETNDLVVLTSYYAKRWGTGMYNTAKIWETARATSAATSFFEPITINSQQFVDGATSANNPVNAMWVEAYNHWREGENWRLEDNIQCFVSIGTGKPSLEPFGEDPMEVGKTLLRISTDTEKSAEGFQRVHDSLFRSRRAFRFNVAQGLEKIGLEEAKREGEILSATNRYIAIQDVQELMDACAENLKARELSKRLEQLAQRHLSSTITEYRAYRQSDDTFDIQSYINTDTMQNLWEQNMSIVWCSLHPDEQHCLGASLMSNLLASQTQRALYYSFSRDVVLASRTTEGINGPIAQAWKKMTDKDSSRGPEAQMLSIFFSSLICQVITDWPHITHDPPRISPRFSKQMLEEVGAILGHFVGVEFTESVLWKTFSCADQPTVLFLDKVDNLADVELKTILTRLQHMARLFNKTFRIVFVGKYSECTMKYLGGFRCVDSFSEYQDCLKSLSFEEFNVRRDQVEDATQGTNEWIWSHPSYQAFASATTSLLWIEGKPGSGKSVLAKSIVERLRQNPSHDKGPFSRTQSKVLVSDWFYHRRGGARYVTHDGLFMSMALHFLQQNSRILHHFLPAYRRVSTFPNPEAVAKRPSAFQWPRELLEIVLNAIARSGESLLVVTDALDEAEDVTILSWIVNFLKVSAAFHVKFIILSRPGPAIEKYLIHFHRILVERENQHDLSVVVDEGLEKARAALHYFDFESLSQVDKSLVGQDSTSPCEPDWILQNSTIEHTSHTEEEALRALREFLLENAKSSMLWVKLVLHDAKCQLEEGLASFADLYETLRRLPPELEDYYKRIAADLPRPKGRTQQGRTRKILMLISGISEIRALSLEELWEAMSVPIEIQTSIGEAKRSETLMASTCIPPRSYDEFRRILQSICGPFLEFLEPQERHRIGSTSQSRTLIVQLMHQTVKDFLSDAAASGPLFFTAEEASSLIMRLSLSYQELALQQYHRLLEEAKILHRIYTSTQKMVSSHQSILQIVEWFNQKPMLPCTSHILHGDEDLTEFYGLTFGDQKIFDQALLLSKAAELGHVTAIKNLLLISKAAPGHWLDQHREITHCIVHTAARSNIPAFDFSCRVSPGFQQRFQEPKAGQECWVTVPWELTVTYKPRNLKLTTAVKGWNPLLDQVCGSRSGVRGTSPYSLRKVGDKPQNQSQANAVDIEKALVMVMGACRDAQAVERGFHWSWEVDPDIIEQLKPSEGPWDGSTEEDDSGEEEDDFGDEEEEKGEIGEEDIYSKLKALLRETVEVPEPPPPPPPPALSHGLGFISYFVRKRHQLERNAIAE